MSISKIGGRKMMRAIICDIDGVLANCDLRKHHITGVKDYAAFYSEIPRDTPILNTIRLLKDLDDKYYIILITGRPDLYRKETEEWLATWGVKYDVLHMRKDGDHRPDTDIKLDIYNEFISGKYHIIAIFEDRTRVVKMWRELHLPCWQNTFWEE